MVGNLHTSFPEDLNHSEQIMYNGLMVLMSHVVAKSKDKNEEVLW